MNPPASPSRRRLLVGPGRRGTGGACWPAAARQCAAPRLPSAARCQRQAPAPPGPAIDKVLLVAPARCRACTTATAWSSAPTAAAARTSSSATGANARRSRCCCWPKRGCRRPALPRGRVQHLGRARRPAAVAAPGRAVPRRLARAGPGAAGRHGRADRLAQRQLLARRSFAQAAPVPSAMPAAWPRPPARRWACCSASWWPGRRPAPPEPGQRRFIRPSIAAKGSTERGR